MLKDITAAQLAARPHQEAASASLVRIRTLLEEMEDEHSGLDPEERAKRQRELDELCTQLAEQQEASQRPMDELKARYPKWIS